MLFIFSFIVATFNYQCIKYLTAVSTIEMIHLYKLFQMSQFRLRIREIQPTKVKEIFACIFHDIFWTWFMLPLPNSVNAGYL